MELVWQMELKVKISCLGPAILVPIPKPCPSTALETRSGIWTQHDDGRPDYENPRLDSVREGERSYGPERNLLVPCELLPCVSCGTSYAGGVSTRPYT